jgi:hypothetical protein
VLAALTKCQDGCSRLQLFFYVPHFPSDLNCVLNTRSVLAPLIYFTHTKHASHQMFTTHTAALVQWPWHLATTTCFFNFVHKVGVPAFRAVA